MATASITANDGPPFYLPRDPRTTQWYFSGNKQLITLLLVAYIYIVKVGGPRFMKNRKPYDGIKPLITFYNAFMVATAFAVINGAVHVVMYTYYFLSSLGPEVQKYLWWKRYITQLQLVQFVVLFVHSLMPFFFNCNYPRSHTYITMSQAAFFFGLFMNFYVQSYQKKTHVATKSVANGKMH
ncbi:hypothetical protein HPB52_025065 [Rhipicephalus sanguineus]|uniref:Elongation of very long chain fatty acids protein n=1 Tax=Rhipicephalus sanguineus TaxID=34632 RepID=A0A9D4YRZ2_RHISA|nr:hypothetical protein HPB52_025065 [Rhipicephalus sanguineus]